MKRKSNYDKYPFVKMPAGKYQCWQGWNAILKELGRKLTKGDGQKKIVVVECYQGVFEQEIADALQEGFENAMLFNSSEAMRSSADLDQLLQDDITGDEIFGYMTRRNIDCYFDHNKTASLRQRIENAEHDLIFIYGTGAAYIQEQYDLLVYADMARWEIQMRFRKNAVSNIGVQNADERASLQYKRAFFVDWRICDRFKKKLMPHWDLVLDTNIPGNPKMTTGEAVLAGLRQATQTPFRVVPFFDPGPWGGQWMKEVCDLDRNTPNFAWCFDCVPEENSLLLGFDNIKFEIPASNLVFAYPKQLLGDPVHARFGDEFPIRFDFLDTMEGGNLSLQVHPLTEYIQEKFGMHYTQDESYYFLDAADDAVVYLGIKEGIDKEAMINELQQAQSTGAFDAEKYVQTYPVKKHDHVLIPAGTIHCSGSNSMVLEISATPYIFTFKLWDWGRLGLDGRPRPINIGHGKASISWERTASWVEKELLHQEKTIASGEGWYEERTGLHKREFIETRRHWFTQPVTHHTEGCVNVLNLVEGEEAMVESPDGAFDPFIVHYAETFIVPAGVTAYTIRPFGLSEGKQCVTLKAFVRNHA
ncbi:class I mannose-6-phosphate isomerase [Pseudobacter ginsenosidimutans]|uniref:Mannose-6-phosphate isomerase class I n=1 Tax=Pseudobacter ginsenosidimutans TaxID=661488 RepID=A0A4Q7MQW8_9BACT|nr:class I mannose-6-phosphate isomerase [Pseudobacter ginsenosidimutans]QEC40261.1 mannose-6-phosphate isomerase [Pseudobacter ginsenosidimutans]RZS69139.1 mannose-6-phosphate isomerase class I [Pseudobacter ginsenosidimutans]